MDKQVYWIWLQHAFGAGSHKPWLIHRRFGGGVEEFHEGNALLWNSMKFISEKEARMLSVFNLEQAEILLEICEKLGHKVVTPVDENYPDALRNIFNPPAALYYRGVLPDVDLFPTVAIVGARKAMQKSIDAALTIGYQLAISDAVVVSGGALGVDSAAHRGAMRGMGKTIAVLPCGLTNGYLIENHSLREKIAENGTLITEYPIDTPVTKGTFQIRNRLISGFSCGTLIVEAQEKSGSMITAKHAKEQNRDVFVYIGEPENKAFSGCEALLRDGAKRVNSGDDILEEYHHRFMPYILPKPKRLKEKKNEKSIVKVSVPKITQPVMSDINARKDIKREIPSTEKVRLVLSKEACHFSEIEKKTNLSSAEVLAALTELELEGEVQSFSGRRYALA